MDKYFNINFEFSKECVFNTINETLTKEKYKGYICVADGVVLSHVHEDMQYRKIVNNAIFSICDSRWITHYIKWIYGTKHKQYCGCDIFSDIIQTKKYKMMFLGAQESILISLKNNLVKTDERIQNMPFIELPFCNVEDFNYVEIAENINAYKPDIIWIALGAPKQEYFMAYLEPFLNHGIMIAVGAVFNFFSGHVQRAPQWMIKTNIEFLYRIVKEPAKQLKRCKSIVLRLPVILFQEYKRCISRIYP